MSDEHQTETSSLIEDVDLVSVVGFGILSTHEVLNTMLQERLHQIQADVIERVGMAFLGDRETFMEKNLNTEYCLELVFGPY